MKVDQTQGSHRLCDGLRPLTPDVAEFGPARCYFSPMSDVSNNNNNDDDDDDDEEEEDDEDIITMTSACLALLGEPRAWRIASCEVRAITTGAHPVYDLIFLTEGGGAHSGGGLGRVRSYRFGALRQFNETLASSPAVRGKPMAAKFPATNAKSKFLGLSSAEVEARRAQLQAWLQELLDDVRPRMPLMLRHAALHFFNFDEALFFGENLPPAAADGTSTGASGGGFEIGSGGETTRSAAAAAAAVAGGAGASGGAAALEKRGYMAKEGHLVKNWKLRYFELGWELPIVPALLEPRKHRAWRRERREGRRRRSSGGFRHRGAPLLQRLRQLPALLRRDGRGAAR